MELVTIGRFNLLLRMCREYSNLKSWHDVDVNNIMIQSDMQIANDKENEINDINQFLTL